MHARVLSRTVPRLMMMMWGGERCGKVRRRVYAMTKVAQNLELAKALDINLAHACGAPNIDVQRPCKPLYGDFRVGRGIEAE